MVGHPFDTIKTEMQVQTDFEMRLIAGAVETGTFRAVIEIPLEYTLKFFDRFKRLGNYASFIGDSD